MANAPRNSVQMFKEMLGLVDVPTTQATHFASKSKKKKHSMSNWDNFTTVARRRDAIREAQEAAKAGNLSKFAKARGEIVSWAIPALVGFVTATSGCVIEKIVEFCADLREGYCVGNILAPKKEACENWHDWEYGYLFYCIISTGLALISATMTWAFAPMARGSGIPEIKTILGGFSMPQVLEVNTLFVKIFGLSLSVASGLSCGKEGPMVHIACCWSNLISKFVPHLANNQSKQRELLSCACTAGVAVAFGAPLGGVLFTYEEASSYFPSRTMLRAFFAGSVAALSLAWYNPTGTGKLTMFESPNTQPPAFTEYVFFLLIGVLGGLIGCVFIVCNIRVSKGRAPGTWFKKRCPNVLEVTLIALLTGITSYPFLMTRILSNVAIRGMFHPCVDMSVDRHTYMLDMCKGSHSDPGWPIVGSILLCGLLRFVQMIFTFGTAAPAGLFIPSLLTGACVGRAIGHVMWHINRYGADADLSSFASSFHFTEEVNPGIYAMIGAASVLGGVCRVSISLVVIMFELTGGLQLIVPFMIACMSAKWTGDAFTPGIYDYMITVRKYPFLHEPDDLTHATTASEIMDDDLDVIHPEPGYVGNVARFLRATKYGGFPIVGEDRTLYGYLHTSELLGHLERQIAENPMVEEKTPCVFKVFVDKPSSVYALDLSSYIDKDVTRCVPEAHCSTLHNIFRHLGVKIILIQDKAKLVGLITKKSFIRHMDELHHGHDFQQQHKVQAALEEKEKEKEGAEEGPGNADRRRSQKSRASQITGQGREGSKGSKGDNDKSTPLLSV